MLAGLSAGAQPASAARVAIGAVFFANGCGLGLWAAHVPVVRDGLGLSEGALGVALLGMAAGAIASMPSMGWLANRYGSRRCTVVGGVAFALLLALPLAAPSWPLLIAATFLLGAANGSLDVAQSTQGTAVERVLGRPIMSSVNGFFSLGGVVGAGAASLLLAAGGPAAPKLALAGLALAALVALAGRSLLTDRAADGDEGGHGFRLPTGAAATLGVLALLSVLAEWAMMDWSAVYLADVLAAPASVAALGFAAFSAAMMLGRFTGDAVVRRLGVRRVLTLSGALAAAGIAVATTAGHPAVAVPGFALAGLGLANLFPVLISAASRLPGMTPSAGVAAVATLAYAGGLIGPVLIGFGAEAVGLRAALGLLVLVGIAIGVAGATGRVGGVPTRAEP